MRATFDAFKAFIGTGMNAMRPGSMPGAPGPQAASTSGTSAPQVEVAASARQRSDANAASLLAAAEERRKTLLGGA
ncbi:MAG: hypothetical protein AB7U76_24415 [Pirellulales bacterium]